MIKKKEFIDSSAALLFDQVLKAMQHELVSPSTNFIWAMDEFVWMIYSTKEFDTYKFSFEARWKIANREGSDGFLGRVNGVCCIVQSDWSTFDESMLVPFSMEIQKPSGNGS